jgi:hypothetical protein
MTIFIVVSIPKRADQIIFQRDGEAISFQDYQRKWIKIQLMVYYKKPPTKVQKHNGKL